MMRMGVPFAALLALFFGTAAQARSEHQVWFAPNIGARDTLELFTREGDWARSRSKIDVFQLYIQNTFETPCEGCGSNVLDGFVQRQAFAKLEQWGIDLAIEMGVVKWGTPEGCDGSANIQGAISMFERLRRVGAKVRYISMDDPLVSGAQDCHQSLEDTAKAIARFTREVKGAYSRMFPQERPVQIGLVESYPTFSMGTILNLMDRVRANGGVMDFFHPDLDHNAVKVEKISDKLLKKDLLAARAYCLEAGMKFGHIFFGVDGATDFRYWRSVMSWIWKVRRLTGAPEQIVFQSWAADPKDPSRREVPTNLPEKKWFTHTEIIRHGLWLLGVRRGLLGQGR